MAHKALYRTWRPQTFRDVVGQQHITRTLQNSLKEGRLSHAYLFSGPRGTGKTSVAKILAKAVNCESGLSGEPCNECETCRQITKGSLVGVVEIDAASNRGVDEIRDLRERVKYAHSDLRQKVYIIDEVHMLTAEAFNALLKTLEEPPAHVMFILATTEPHKLPATIISRCQRFDFRRVSLEEQAGRLEFICREEGVAIDSEAVQYIARLSEGGMRDALSLLDQMISFAGNHITYEGVVSMTGGISSEIFENMVECIRSQDVGGALQIIDRLLREGKSADRCLETLLLYIRDLLMIKMVPQSQAVTDRILDVSRYSKVAAAFTQDRLFRMIETLNRYQTEMKYSTQPQTLFEVAVMKCCTDPETAPAEAQSQASPAADSHHELSQLKQKIAQLEQQLTKLMQTGIPSSGEAPAAKPDRSPLQRTLNGSNAAGKRVQIKLDGYIEEKDSPHFKQVLLKWNQILAQVKEHKVTLHAWLKDGEPVSYSQDTVLVAFRNSIHRETTEKPANKQLIEQVLTEVLGHPSKVATVMLKDWTEAQDGFAAQPPEELTLEPEEPNAVKEEWIGEAIRLFGEDLVTVKDD